MKCSKSPNMGDWVFYISPGHECTGMMFQVTDYLGTNIYKLSYGSRELICHVSEIRLKSTITQEEITKERYEEFISRHIL